MLSFMFGLVAVLIAIFAMSLWCSDVLAFLKGMFPVSLFFAGLIAMIAGVASMSSKPQGSKKES